MRDHDISTIPPPLRLACKANYVFQEFACNGTLVDDEESGQVIQLQGDQRLKISTFLVQEGIPKASIKVHGF